jgi:hypothetical protein
MSCGTAWVFIISLVRHLLLLESSSTSRRIAAHLHNTAQRERLTTLSTTIFTII